VIAPLIAALALAWTALLVAAPLLPTVAAALTYAFCAALCHQLADRSFHLGAWQLPVCARCLGIYAGFAASALAVVVVRGGGAPRVARGGTARLVVAAGCLPTMVTVAAEWAGWPASNLVRFAAGVPLGAAVGVVAVAGLHYGECAPRRPIAPSQGPSPI
jgi:uncharacterized membrane protein